MGTGHEDKTFFFLLSALGGVWTLAFFSLYFPIPSLKAWNSIDTHGILHN